MGKEQIPDDADPVYREVMESIRQGKNPDHARLKKLDAKKRKEVQQAADKAKRKRRGAHRDGDGDVFNTGMFD